MKRFLCRTLLSNDRVSQLMLLESNGTSGWNASPFNAETEATVLVDEPVALINRDKLYEAIQLVKSVSHKLPYNLLKSTGLLAPSGERAVPLILDPKNCRPLLD